MVVSAIVRHLFLPTGAETTMKSKTLNWNVLFALSCIVFLCSWCRTTNAGLVINMTEVGSNVVANGNGTLDTTALTLSGAGGNHYGWVSPTAGALSLGASATGSFDAYNGITGPANFGSGGFTAANSGSGSIFELYSSFFVVAQGFVSNSSLSNTTTWTNTSLASLGATPGTYTWTWGTPGAPNFDFVTLNITAAPEPSSVVLVGLSFMFALARRKRH